MKKKEDLDATIRCGQNGMDRDGKEERRETEAYTHTHNLMLRHDVNLYAAVKIALTNNKRLLLRDNYYRFLLSQKFRRQSEYQFSKLLSVSL